MSPSGRIAANQRPKIDFKALPPPVELDDDNRKLRLQDIDPYIGELIERAFSTGKPFGQILGTEDQAKEFARQCQAYGRLRQPEISLGVKISPMEANNGRQPFRVRVSAGPKIRRKRKITPLEAVPTETATGE